MQPDLDTATWTGDASSDAAGVGSEVALTVAAHFDLDRVGEVALLGPLDGLEVTVGRLEPGFVGPAGERPLGDPGLSRSGVLRLAASGTDVLVEAQGTAAVRVDGAALHGPHRLPATDLERGVVLQLAQRVVLVLHWRAPDRPPGPSHGLVGESDGLAAVRSAIDKVGPLELPVLIRGETGTGKELVSAAIHRVSPRRDGPHVCVDLGAIPTDLAASELFGHVRGAFSGARSDRTGRMRQAHGGTLFLDELGEASPEVQALLLRAIETHQVRPVGSEEVHDVDLRLITATDAPLESAVAEGRFKAPLLHRVAGYVIVLPPLRWRRDDIGRLLVHFLRLEAEAVGLGERAREADPRRPWLPAWLGADLVRRDWPGNVRELRNAARQLVVSSLGADVLAASEPEPEPEPEPPPARSPDHDRAEPISDDRLVEALRACDYRRGPAARHLGIARSTLYALIDRSERVRKTTDLDAAQIEEATEASAGDLIAAARRLEVSARGLKLRMRELGLLD